MDWLGYISEDWPLTLNCTKYKPEKPLLCLFNSGRSCVKFSEMSDEEVVQNGLTMLKTVYPDAPDTCKSFIRTNWLKDKYAKMSYACVVAGGSP